MFTALVCGYVTLVVQHAILRRVPRAVPVRNHRVSSGAARALPTAADLRATRGPSSPDACARRVPFRDHVRPIAPSGLADDPTTRALHGGDRPRRGRHRHNVCLMYPYATNCFGGARAIRPQDRWARARSKAGLLQPGARHSARNRARKRLPGDRPRFRCRLQPASQRSRTLCAGPFSLSTFQIGTFCTLTASRVFSYHRRRHDVGWVYRYVL